jgi:hypothetical protein
VPGSLLHTPFQAGFVQQGTRLGGTVNLRFESADGPLTRLCRVDDTAVTSLAVQDGNATLLAGVTVTDMTRRPVVVARDAMLPLEMRSTGTLSATVWDPSGQRLLSSSWDGAASVQRRLERGAVTIR